MLKSVLFWTTAVHQRAALRSYHQITCTNAPFREKGRSTSEFHAHLRTSDQLVSEPGAHSLSVLPLDSKCINPMTEANGKCTVVSDKIKQRSFLLQKLPENEVSPTIKDIGLRFPDLSSCRSIFPVIYTFPEIISINSVIQAPSSLNFAVEKLDPEKSIDKSIKAPSISRPWMHAVRSMIIIKRWRIKKKKLIKRIRKNWHQIKKRNEAMEKKLEEEFRFKAQSMLADAINFDPEAHVKDIISKAKWEPPKTTITGKKIYPHWTTLMTVEELYGVPKSSHIDKSALLPDEEDLEKLRELKKKYHEAFGPLNEGRQADEK